MNDRITILTSEQIQMILDNWYDYISITSGSKGDYFNIAQITGLLGPQNLTGARIPPVLNDNTRTIPHYDYNIKVENIDASFESKGFIKLQFTTPILIFSFFLNK